MQKREVKSREQMMREIARDAAREAVHDVLAAMGMDCKHPREVKADMAYLNRRRKESEYRSLKLQMLLIGTVLSSLSYIIWSII